EIRPDSIRLARDLTTGLNADISKMTFVESMKEVSNLLDIEVFAENVKADIDYEVLKIIGISGASR
ncbi:MAG: bifunctional diguanylate cyclase/phosphodiesterase, partial [Gammaproteobacteria bacterium]